MTLIECLQLLVLQQENQAALMCNGAAVGFEPCLTMFLQ